MANGIYATYHKACPVYGGRFHAEDYNEVQLHPTYSKTKDDPASVLIIAGNFTDSLISEQDVKGHTIYLYQISREGNNRKNFQSRLKAITKKHPVISEYLCIPQEGYYIFFVDYYMENCKYIVPGSEVLEFQTIKTMEDYKVFKTWFIDAYLGVPGGEHVIPSENWGHIGKGTRWQGEEYYNNYENVYLSEKESVVQALTDLGYNEPAQDINNFDFDNNPQGHCKIITTLKLIEQLEQLQEKIEDNKTLDAYDYQLGRWKVPK